MKKRNLAIAMTVLTAGSIFYGTIKAEAGSVKLDEVQIVFKRDHDDRYYQPAPPPPPPPPPHHHPRDDFYRREHDRVERRRFEEHRRIEAERRWAEGHGPHGPHGPRGPMPGGPGHHGFHHKPPHRLPPNRI